MYLANKFQNIHGSADTLLELAGITKAEIHPVAEAMERGGRLAAAAAVTDAILDRCKPIAGTPTTASPRSRSTGRPAAHTSCSSSGAMTAWTRYGCLPKRSSRKYVRVLEGAERFDVAGRMQPVLTAIREWIPEWEDRTTYMG